jgi:hypothetical protein
MNINVFPENAPSLRFHVLSFPWRIFYSCRFPWRIFNSCRIGNLFFRDSFLRYFTQTGRNISYVFSDAFPGPIQEHPFTRVLSFGHPSHPGTIMSQRCLTLGMGI